MNKDNKMHVPDNWIIIKLESPSETLYKVFSTWRGGFSIGDRWRLNSGIEKVEEDGDYYNFIGYSGSVYRCNKHNYGTSNYTGSVIANAIKQDEKENTIITIINSDTNFLELLNGN